MRQSRQTSPLSARAAALAIGIIALALVAGLLIQPSGSSDTEAITEAAAEAPSPDELRAQQEAARAAREAEEHDLAVRTIEYASAVEEARLERVRIEWEAAAEAQRIFDEQAAQAERDRQARAARQAQAQAQTPSPPATVSSSGGGSGCVIPDYICQRESRHNYGALNASSGAGGMYQLMPSTANAIAASIGRHDLVGTPPHLMSPADQDLLASTLWAGGAGACHWAGGSYCSG